MLIIESLKQGSILCEKGDFEAAIDIYAKALKANGPNAEVLYAQSKAYFKVRLFDKALENLDQLLLKDTNNAELISERAVVLHHLGDNEEALKALNQAASLDINNPFRYSSRAWIKARMGDLEGAVSDYEEAIRLDPEDAIAYNNKGLLEEQLGRKQASVKSFDQSNQLAGYQPSFEGRKEAEVQREPTNSEEDDLNQGQALTFKTYWNTLRGLLTSREERGEFFDFLKRKKR